ALAQQLDVPPETLRRHLRALQRRGFARPGPDGWTTATPLRTTTTLALPILGLLAALGYVPAAMFNVRRALFSRITRKRKVR
ncbi:MAG: hypothetical protein ACK4YP_19370, partial [Myxococcota bacterium]